MHFETCSSWIYFNHLYQNFKKKLDVFCTDCVKEGALQSAALHRILYNVKEGLLYTEMLTVSESAGMLSAGVFVFVLVFASDICHQC